jgi:hypothetical protein
MTKFTQLTLALVGALLLVGCSTASKPGNCGCLEGNLCGWNFYKPADMIEGQAVGCRDLCAPQPCCAPGISYTTTEVPASAPAAAPDEMNIDGDLPAPVVEDAGVDTTADFGPPADAR